MNRDPGLVTHVIIQFLSHNGTEGLMYRRQCMIDGGKISMFVKA